MEVEMKDVSSDDSANEEQEIDDSIYNQSITIEKYVTVV